MKPFSDSLGGALTQDGRRIAVWRKGALVPGYDPASVRQDVFGCWILFQDYGNRDSAYGWEIDHIVPVADGGSDGISNLHPLNWSMNVRLGAKGPAAAILTGGK